MIGNQCTSILTPVGRLSNKSIQHLEISFLSFHFFFPHLPTVCLIQMIEYQAQNARNNVSWCSRWKISNLALGNDARKYTSQRCHRLYPHEANCTFTVKIPLGTNTRSLYVLVYVHIHACMCRTVCPYEISCFVFFSPFRLGLGSQALLQNVWCVHPPIFLSAPNSFCHPRIQALFGKSALWHCVQTIETEASKDGQNFNSLW